MDRINFRAIFAIVIGLFVSSGALAQERVAKPSVADKYVISAKAGGVNHTVGTVTVIRSNGKSGILLKGDLVEIGDRVSTAADGRAEVLLNPGSYIRIAGNSSFEFGTTDLEDLQIRLDSGSAMFEVFAANEFRVSVFTPKGMVSLVETGVYRIDISADGSGTIAVTEGKAEVGEANPTKVKGGRTATIGTDTVTIAKFDRGKRDELAEWSRTRAKDLAKMTSALQNRQVRDTWINTVASNDWLYNSFGLWVYSPIRGSFCFMPFRPGWYSPYGFGFGQWFNWYSLCPNCHSFSRYGRIPPVVVSGPPSDPNVKPGSRIRQVTPTEPPFVKVERRREPIFGNDNPLFPHDNSGRGNGGGTIYTPSQKSEPSQPPVQTKRDNESKRDNE